MAIGCTNCHIFCIFAETIRQMVILLLIGILLICLARAIDVMTLGKERDFSMRLFVTICTVLGIFFVVLSLGIIFSAK